MYIIHVYYIKNYIYINNCKCYTITKSYKGVTIA